MTDGRFFLSLGIGDYWQHIKVLGITCG